MFEIFFPLFLVALYFLIKLASRRNQTTVFGAPWVPLKPHVVNQIMELAKIKPNDIFYDLGSGDGRLVIATATQGPVPMASKLTLSVFGTPDYVFFYLD